VASGRLVIIGDDFSDYTNGMSVAQLVTPSSGPALCRLFRFDAIRPCAYVGGLAGQ
jgi:hypothetical protein